MGCVSFSLNENQCFVFCLYSHWACSKKTGILHIQKDTWRLLGLVLHVSVFAAVTLLNCFHPVKVCDKFYRKFLNAKGSGHRFLFLVNFKQALQTN